jgi:hypothetical protein
MEKRIEQAKQVCINLLDDLENSSNEIDAILMKAQRLARLVRDTDAQTWLKFETIGYPKDFNFSTLNGYEKYPISSGRFKDTEQMYIPVSLPELEAQLESEKAQLESLKIAKTSFGKVSDFTAKNATEALLKTQLTLESAQKKNYVVTKSLYSSLKSSIHSFASDVYISLELGDIAENIFTSARDLVDSFIQKHSASAAEKLISINERMLDNTIESRSLALTSCRRLLMDIADSVFPAQEKPWLDRNGKERKVGAEQYKNRIIAYISGLEKSDGNVVLLDADIAHLAARLDAIYEKTCKGVHVDVDEKEAKFVVIQTYLMIGEIAKIADGKSG